MAEAKRWQHQHLSSAFMADSQREQAFTYSHQLLELDLSGQCIDRQVLDQLFSLANEMGMNEAIESLFCGEKVNNTEGRAALHMALRCPKDSVLPIPKQYIDLAQNERAKMQQFCQVFQSGRYLTASGECFTDIVLVGIGGSFLGPKLAYDALKPYHHADFKLHFLANLDPCEFYDLVEEINPLTTLVVVASKTFTTLETLKNAESLKRWLLEGGISPHEIARHLVALTANTAKAKAFGVLEENIFTLWDWVGGRFSSWSAIGLPLMLATSIDTFNNVLAGAYSMDEHFYQVPQQKNLPILLALIDIWNINFRGVSTRAVVPYSHRLSNFSEYLKQLEMESNGKSVNRDGKAIEYQTACSVWGGIGTLGQHAFFQLLHQGTQEMPIEFIRIIEPERELDDHHQWLNANLKGQMLALRDGTYQQSNVANYGQVAGSKAASLITLQKLTPQALGALMAMYEHKVYAQAVIWQINPFDQFGVELGKGLAKKEL